MEDATIEDGTAPRDPLPIDGVLLGKGGTA